MSRRLRHKRVISTSRIAWIFVGAVALLEAVSILLFFVAADFSLATLNDPARLIRIGDTGAHVMRAAALLDMFGYLSAIPLAGYMRDRFRGEPGIDLFTLLGVVFLVMGALAAAIFAFAATPLIHDYAHGQNTLLVFTTIDRIVFTAMWQTVDALVSAVWFIGVGWLAWRRAQRRLSAALMTLGVIGLVFAALHISALFPGSA